MNEYLLNSRKKSKVLKIKMTKNHCKICELLGERKVPEDHGLSHPCHLSSLHQLNYLNINGLNCSQNSSIDYANYGLLNGLYLPQLKDMMLAAYLLRGCKKHPEENAPL
ncbi:Protein of unknown function [Cotesia congregata]|uniref:Uncharacterized protein n=1 Tax=Cotesia congregata TaxID=51543 RepID=A0A8J2HHD4_COTCN|nr:Protein of unknown function [Cotesia congregata]